MSISNELDAVHPRTRTFAARFLVELVQRAGGHRAGKPAGPRRWRHGMPRVPSAALAAGRGVAQFRREGEARAADFLPGRRVAHRSCGTTSRRSESITASRCRAKRTLVTFQGKNGNLMQSPWPFAPAGQSGKMISTLLAEHGAARRRHRVHSLDAIEDQHARPRLRVHEHRAASSKAFPAPALGSAMRSAARTRTCRRTWRFPISAASRPTAKRIGATAFCRPSIRPS